MPRRSLASHLLPAALLLLAPAAHADTRDTILPEHGARYHVRTADPQLLALIDEGMRRSPTFRALVERLVGSDIVVYLQCAHDSPSGVDGRLTFASAAGGYRYILVRLRPQRSRAQMLGLIGHELRHAVEVAETPAIVDAASLAREYGRLGYVQRWNAAGISFDTDAAIDAGRQVLGEVRPRARAHGQALAP